VGWSQLVLAIPADSSVVVGKIRAYCPENSVNQDEEIGPACVNDVRSSRVRNDFMVCVVSAEQIELELKLKVSLRFCKEMTVRN